MRPRPPFDCHRCGAPTDTYFCDTCYPSTTDRKDSAPMRPIPRLTVPTIGGIGACFGLQRGQEVGRHE